MKKCFLVNIAARIQADNWINNGHKIESERLSIERFYIKLAYRLHRTINDLKTEIKNTTICSEKLNKQVAAFGLR